MNETLKIIISAEITKLKQAVQEGKSLISKFGEEGAESFKKFNDTVQNAGTKAKSVVKGLGTVMVGLAGSFLALGESTKAYRTGQAKLNTAFEVAGASAETAKQTYDGLYRVLGDSNVAVEAAGHLAKLTTNQKDLQEWTNICKGVYATFGESLPIESLTEAANETAQTGEITGALADALNWAGKSEAEFAEELFWCNNAAEREALIRGTLNDIYQEAGATYEENAESIIKQNEAQERLNQAMAKLGEAAAPVMTVLAEIGAELLENLEPHLDSITETLIGVAETIGSVMGWVTRNWDLVSNLAVVILGIAAAVSVFSTAMSVANAVLYANPIVLLISAIVAAVVALTVVIITYWDEIVGFFVRVGEWFGKMWRGLVDGLTAAWNWTTNLLSTVGSWIYENVIAPVVKFFKEMWEKIVSAYHTVVDPWIEIVKRLAAIFKDKVITPIKNYFVNLWSDIKNVFAVAGNWFKNTVVQPVVNFFSNAWNTVKNGATNAWNGIKAVFSPVAKFFGDIFSTAWTKVKNVFSAGGKIFSGLKEGIERTFKTVVNKIISGINKVVAVPFKAINNMLSKLKSVEIVGIRPFNWVTTFNVPQIPQLAKGGVLAKGQIGLLEGNGAEAVVPLEENTGWLDEIAKRLGGMLGDGTPIILQVDGKTFAQTSISTINKLTKQTGKLGLAIM